MSRFLYRLGRAAARHPWRVLAVWVLAAVAVVGLRSAVGGETTDQFKLPGTESQQAVDLLRDRFPAQAGLSGQVVFQAPEGTTLADPANRAAVAETAESLRATPHVTVVSDPFDPAAPTIAPDGRTGFVTVGFDVENLQPADAEAVIEAVEVGREAGLEVEVGGSIAQAAQEVEGQEAIGLAVAVVVLLVAFGSVVAMGIPIGTALFGIFIGLSLVTVMAGIVDVPTVAPMLATMIGLGVGIDYALFVVTRHRQFLHEGWSVPDAAGRANATAGQAVLFAGMTVVVAICGLFLSGVPAIGTMGLAAGIVVIVSMVAAVTLLPAFLGLAGSWVDRLRIGRRRSLAVQAHDTMAGRWAHRVGRRPWPYALGAFALLVALAAPVLAMRLSMPDDGNAPIDSTHRKAYDLLAGAFGPGFNGPLTIVVDAGAGADVQPALDRVVTALRADDGIANVGAVLPNPAGDTAVIFAYPTTSPQDEATEDLVHHLRHDVLEGMAGAGGDTYVAGWTATGMDISERLSARTPWFIGAVVALSFVLLMILFRSVLVPLKAALMNLLSIGASYGLLVAVFQWGWGGSLIGLDEPMPISPFVPMIMFAILFGLSMDYEVFLLSRVREEFVRHGDSHRSVVDGLAGTARVITSAALIMISVFGAFVLSPEPMLKMFGLGLASAVLIDATVVRMVLVPATMALLGGANWWLPGWLDRILPHVDIEGGPELGTLPTGAGGAGGPAFDPDREPQPA
ncbi:MAG: MMPL family transporter [Acidimicrobiales bacterium]